jgi:S1-C subfamily serine protease
VQQQMQALAADPTPDRSHISASRNREIERDCNYLRRTGIAPYNDCLKQEMATPGAKAETSSTDDFGPNLAQRFVDKIANEKEVAPAVVPVNLKTPGAALARRPQSVGADVLSAAAVYKKVERSVYVVVAAPTRDDVLDRNITQGSAVAVADHLLLTNCHVVMDRPLIRILQDESVAVAHLVGADATTDRCVIRSDGPALAPVSGVRSFADLAVGEHVFAIGTPRSLERSLSEGLISGLRQHTGVDMVQTTAPLSPGSSGGGLFDERGNLIGITTLASLEGSQNLNFAIAASDYWR